MKWALASFAPTTVPSGAGTTAVTLAIQVPHKASSNRNGATFLLAVSLVTGLLLVGNTRRPFSQLVFNCIALLLFASTLAGVAALTTACGSPSSNKSVSPPTVYTVTVSATSGTLSHSTVVTLTLQ